MPEPGQKENPNQPDRSVFDTVNPQQIRERERCEFIQKEAGSIIDEAGQDITKLTQNLTQFILEETKDVHTDELTGLLNRRGLDEELNVVGRIKSRLDFPVTILFIDLDHFKSVNDTYGHAYGDLILKSFGETLRKSTRESDSVCHWGGDEFVVALQNTDEVQAETLLERLKKNWKDQDHPSDITYSIGVHAWGNEETAENVIELADNKMYKDKILKHGK